MAFSKEKDREDKASNYFHKLIFLINDIYEDFAKVLTIVK